MIEMRWVVRPTGRLFRGTNDAGEVADIPQTEQVLQARTVIVWSNAEPSWSDWQDVPVVEDEG